MVFFQCISFVSLGRPGKSSFNGYGFSSHRLRCNLVVFAGFSARHLMLVVRPNSFALQVGKKIVGKNCSKLDRDLFRASSFWRNMRKNMLQGTESSFFCFGDKFWLNSEFPFIAKVFFRYWGSLQSNFKTVWPVSRKNSSMNSHEHLSTAILALWLSRCTVISTWAWKETCGIAGSMHPNKLVKVCGRLARVVLLQVFQSWTFSELLWFLWLWV